MNRKIKLLKEHLRIFKEEADSVINEYRREKAERDRFLQNTDGKYSKNYLDEYKQAWAPSHDYKAILNDLRQQHRGVIDNDLRTIRDKVDSVFGAAPRPEFASQLSAYYSMQLSDDLTDAEFSLMRRQATNFAEMRLVKRLGESRTRQTYSAVMDEGKARYEQQAKPDVFRVDIPDMPACYSDFDDFSASVNRVLSNYAGAPPELDFVNRSNKAEIALTFSSADYFSKDFIEPAFIQTVDELDTVGRQNKRELTKNERELLTYLTDFEKYPTLSMDKAVEISKHDERLKQMFLADTRFGKAVADALGEEA